MKWMMIVLLSLTSSCAGLTLREPSDEQLEEVERLNQLSKRVPEIRRLY